MITVPNIILPSLLLSFKKFSQHSQCESSDCVVRILHRCNVLGSPDRMCNGAPPPLPHPTYFSCTNYSGGVSHLVSTNLPDSRVALLVTVHHHHFVHDPLYKIFIPSRYGALQSIYVLQLQDSTNKTKHCLSASNCCC